MAALRTHVTGAQNEVSLTYRGKETLLIESSTDREVFISRFSCIARNFSTITLQ